MTDCAPEILAKRQYNDPTNLYLRRALFTNSVPKISIHEKALEYLKLDGHENILEVGCGDGKFLLQLRKEHSHAGRLVGLDLSKGMFAKTKKLMIKETLGPGIEFIEGSAGHLDFPDKSFEVILSFYMLYHMTDIEKTLHELERVLKNNGQVLIATNSSKNRERLHDFKKTIGKLTGSKAAPNFSSRFNLENGEKQLEKVFDISGSYVYKGKVNISESKSYLDALESYRSVFEPVPSDVGWKNALDKIKYSIEKEIGLKGRFVDNAKTGFFICRKKGR